MSSLREEIRSALDVSPTIDPAAEVSRRVGFLKDYLRASSTKGFVLGISGGQDSALAGRLCQLAAQESRLEGVAAEFIAVRLPYGVQADEEDAQVALRFIDPDRSIVINIKETSDAATKAVAEALGETPTDFVRGNIKARERMASSTRLPASTGYWSSAPTTRPRRSQDSSPSSATAESMSPHLLDSPNAKAHKSFLTSAHRTVFPTRCPQPIWRTTGPRFPTRSPWASPTRRSTTTWRARPSPSRPPTALSGGTYRPATSERSRSRHLTVGGVRSPAAMTPNPSAGILAAARW
ncbi:NH(3)-dependent NAD(+) synthetase [Mycobacteroides abscessus]|nr:NH(3)-dependent NAD(+) synthetase [Mycobacteroides abscessus]